MFGEQIIIGKKYYFQLKSGIAYDGEVYFADSIVIRLKNAYCYATNLQRVRLDDISFEKESVEVFGIL